MSGSSQKSSSKPVDLTPQSFSNMQQPFADVLMGLLGYQATPQGQTGTGTGTGIQVGNGVTAQSAALNPRPSGVGPQGSIQESQGGHGLYGFGNPRQVVNTAAPQQGVPNYQNTTGGNPLAGIPSYQGNLTAGIGANEQALLDQLMQMQGGGGGGAQGQATGSTAQDFLNRVISGEFVPGEMTPEQVNEFVGQLGLGYTPETDLAGFMDQLSGASNTGAFGGDPSNPFMQAYIESAQRETNRALQETLSRTLPGRFTQAGQFTQPGSSSAFDRAAAIATEGAAAAMGDIATDISYQAYEAAANREAEAMAQELERRGQYGEAARMREAAAKESELQRGAAEREAALGRQQEAALNLPQVQAGEIDNLLKNLQAQALPRLIEEQGIERGLEQFNNQVNALLTTLGITAGVTRPVVGQNQSSSGSSLSIK